MKTVCIINGSLRGQKAASLEFIKDIDRRLAKAEFNKSFVTVRAGLRGGYPEDTLQTMAGANALILVFPLYNYGLPGALMRLLEDYYRYASGNVYNRNARVYMVVNCGFPRPRATSGEAVRVIKNFCRRLALSWRFAVCIGTGPVVVMTRKIPLLYPKLKRAYAEIAVDITDSGSKQRNDYYIKPAIPEPILIQIKKHYERKGQMIQPKRTSAK